MANSSRVYRDGKLVTALALPTGYVAEQDFLVRLREHVDTVHGTVRSAAKYWGISRTWMYQILRGGVKPTKAIENDMGLQRTIVYAPISKEL